MKVNPRKALSALMVAAKRDDYPTELWTTLIQEWPADASARLFDIFLQRLAGLPEATVRELRSILGNWLRISLPALLARDKDLAWRVFDHCISAWTFGRQASAVNRLGEISMGGEPINASGRTLNHAITGPIGAAAEGITRSIRKLKLGQAEGIPGEFKSRLEQLLATPGEGGDHCIAVLAKDLSRLHCIDPDWAAEHLLPLFAFDHHAAEPAWNGLLQSGKVPSSDILIALKELLIDLFPRIHKYGWPPSVVEAGAQWLVEMATVRRDEPGGLSAKEARACLRKMNDDTRQDVISMLRSVRTENGDRWKTLVIPFLNTVWPREKSVRTSASVLSWVSMLESTGDDFPAVYDAVKKFLVPIEDQNYSFYGFTENVDGGTCPTSRYPEKVLDLMYTITPAATDAPPDELFWILELIKESDGALISDPRYNRLLDLVERV